MQRIWHLRAVRARADRRRAERARPRLAYQTSMPRRLRHGARGGAVSRTESIHAESTLTRTYAQQCEASMRAQAPEQTLVARSAGGRHSAHRWCAARVASRRCEQCSGPRGQRRCGQLRACVRPPTTAARRAATTARHLAQCAPSCLQPASTWRARHAAACGSCRHTGVPPPWRRHCVS